MKFETPRTDSEAGYFGNDGIIHRPDNVEHKRYCNIVPIDFARQLEIEIKQLRIALLTCANLAGWIIENTSGGEGTMVAARKIKHYSDQPEEVLRVVKQIQDDALEYCEGLCIQHAKTGNQGDWTDTISRECAGIIKSKRVAAMPNQSS